MCQGNDDPIDGEQLHVDHHPVQHRSEAHVEQAAAADCGTAARRSKQTKHTEKKKQVKTMNKTMNKIK